MTLNIGSNKISRLAIGQADGSVKRISKLNLGSNTIFSSRQKIIYPLPSNPNAQSFYFATPFFDEEKILNGDPNSCYIHNRYGQGVVNIWYNGNYDSDPDISRNTTQNDTVNLTKLLPNFTKNTLIQFTAQYNTASPTTNPLISIKNTLNNKLYSCVLCSMPSINNLTIVSHTLANFMFQSFNENGSIIDMNETCFIFDDPELTFGTKCFNRFNMGGLLKRIPNNSFDTSILTNTTQSDVFELFNGTASAPGGLTTNKTSTLKSYNTVFVNKNFASTMDQVDNNGTGFEIPVNSSYEWNSTPYYQGL